MYIQVNKSKENSSPVNRQESRAVANSVWQKKSDGKEGLGFVDNRPEVASQRQIMLCVSQGKKNNNIYNNHDVMQLTWSRDTKATGGIELNAATRLFRERKNNGDAKSCKHNYAYDWYNDRTRISDTGSHAEQKIIQESNAPENTIKMVSEFRPCDSCRNQMERTENSRGITISVDYLMDYKATGDGNPSLTRGYYSGYGWLSDIGTYGKYLGKEVAWYITDDGELI